MKKLLSLAFIVLGLTTASAFAQSTTVPTDTTQTQQPATGKSGKHGKHKKGAHKGHRKSQGQTQDQPKAN